jgi:hypothetical protein
MIKLKKNEQKKNGGDTSHLPSRSLLEILADGGIFFGSRNHPKNKICTIFFLVKKRNG